MGVFAALASFLGFRYEAGDDIDLSGRRASESVFAPKMMRGSRDLHHDYEERRKRIGTATLQRRTRHAPICCPSSLR